MYQDKSMNQLVTMQRSWWLCAIVLLGLAVGYVPAAQSAAPASDPNTLTQGDVIDPNQAALDQASGLIKFIAFQKDSNIKDGLRLLAALCKKNIVPSPGVEGRLTVARLYNVTFEKALDAILGNSFRYEQDGDFVRVYTPEEYKQIKADPSRMVHEVVTLYYITAEEAQKLVKPVLSDKAIIAITTPAQKTISGASSSAGGGSGGGLTTSGGGDDQANNDMIVIYDYPENVEKAKALLADVDVRPRQVLVEATILSARLDDTTQFGIDWNLLSGVAITGYPSSIVGGQGTPIETFGLAQNPVTARGLTAGVSADNVQAIVTALEEVMDTTLLANPKILAVNKQEGQVLIGKKLGYVDTTTQNINSTTQSVKFLNTGTQLVFRPYIGDDGYIRMDIYPKDSDGIVKDNGIPDETTTELRTNVVVKDGETIVIGGLFRDNVITSRSQVPVLGDIPFVGVLFRGTKDQVQREEVIILLTPHIIREAADTDPQQRLDDIRLKRHGARDELQLLDNSKLAEDAYARAAKYYLEGNLGRATFNLKLALMLRPTYLEALRLRERIVAETNPEELKRLDSIAEEEVNRQEAPNWVRR
jgi:type IV pilus assembly protein PilQ